MEEKDYKGAYLVLLKEMERKLHFISEREIPEDDYELGLMAGEEDTLKDLLLKSYRQVVRLENE